MKFRLPAIVALVLHATCDQSIAQTQPVGKTQAANPTSRIAWSPEPVEKAAYAAKKTNQLLGELLKMNTRRIEGRYFRQGGLWWYWMPEGYWAVWDGESWSRYQR